MRKKHLRILHDYLDLVPEEKFDMNSWFKGDKEHLTLNHDVLCDTSACAAGWATTIPEFAEKGLTLQFSPDGKRGYISYKGEGAFRALEKFFGLLPSEVHEIFAMRGGQDNSIAAVQRRIRDVIREDKSL